MFGKSARQSLRIKEIASLEKMFDAMLADLDAEMRRILPLLDEYQKDWDPRLRYWPLNAYAQQLLDEQTLATAGRFNTQYEKALLG